MFTENKHCYDFQENNYSKGLFDDFVDVTYIITSYDDVSRNKNIQKQLEKLIPTQKIFFVYNNNYKKCKKNILEQMPPYDLKDANLNIMNHSIENNFNNILILENDFIYSDIILDSNKNNDITQEIKNFLNDNSNKPLAYNLGPNIYLINPLMNIFKYQNTFKIILGGGNHAVIYNKKIQLELIKQPKNIITKQFNDIYKNMDTYLNLNFDVYFYKKPLIYQIWPETENQDYWTENTIFMNLLSIKKKILSLDKYPEPGYSINYNIVFFISYLLFFILFCLFLFIFYYIFSLIIKSLLFNRFYKFIMKINKNNL